MRGFLVERELTAISTIIEAILGEMRELGDHAFALHVDGPRRELVIANAVLARPMPQADPSIRRAVEAECERLLEARQRRSGAAARVRARLLEQPDAMPSMADLASELHLDVRTLRRHLAADGTTFRALRQEVCTVLAVELLETVGLGVGEVAARLGYSDATAFTHAFTRWKGKPPSALS
ncbi:AraC family transcriptional regulator [Conexibacter sp. W3-3-2]|uniref:helix-turn-helix domain-containing protein n=1 Tax=Conexibacter sp. W3-3-2 TaxID=2675227 RepID=UPI002815FF91|nr:AraC family transcriptional regulator [Conexibacter sp. W3-3-2]